MERVKAAGKKAWNWGVRYPLALVATTLLILGASFLMLFGMGDRFNVGGVIGMLFGKKPNKRDRVNVVPPKRKVDLEEQDGRGFIQWEVEGVPKPLNPFRDKTKIRVKDPVSGQKKTLDLPEGVQDRDVSQVIEVNPGAFEVVVLNGPDARITDDDLDLFKEDPS